MTTSEEGLIALEGKCYSCKKVENCKRFEELLKVYSEVKRSLRRKVQLSIDGCRDYEPWKKKEELSHDSQFVC